VDRLQNFSEFNTDKIIKSQRALGDVRFGIFGNAARNSCGVVSIHNLKVILGIKTSFDKDYKNASRWGTNLAVGIFGTNPFYVARKLSQMNIKKKTYPFPNDNRLIEIFKAYDLMVVAYSWGKIMNLHYAVFEKKSDGKIVGYNSNKCCEHADVKALICDEPIKKAIVVWGINRV